MIKARFKKLLAITAAVLAVILHFSSTLGGGAVFASAASAYSNVLEDLQKDTSFNVAEYPAGGKDYILKVIQVAESSDKELFVFVYQPYGKLTASSISISKTMGDDYSPKKYTLSFLNSSGVFYKYIVNDFKLETEAERYYNISQIWRKYDRQIDGEQTDGQIKTEIPYKVGAYWKVTDGAEAVTYDKQEVKTVEIENPYVSSVRYPNGLSWTTSESCDGHFVSFDTDYDITRLLSADVTFRTQDYTQKGLSKAKYSEPSELRYKTLNNDDKPIKNNVNGLFGKQYKWQSVSRTSDFVKDVNLKDGEVKDNLLKRTWVLNFLQTGYSSPVGADNAVSLFLFNPFLGAGALAVAYNAIDLLFSESEGTIVSEVAVLRLEFEADGKVYNLGTVSNVVTGPEKPPVEQPDEVEDFWQKVLDKLGEVPAWAWVIIIVAVVAIVVGVLSIFFPALRGILKGLWLAVKWLCKVLWLIISAPFRGIAALVKLGRERRNRKRAEREKQEQTNNAKPQTKKPRKGKKKKNYNRRSH